jgi:hypothetical protein
MSLIAFWARISRTTRILLLALLVLGLGLLAAGLTADHYGWWATRPFLTNVISGLTSACFGVPFALLVLSSLTSMEDSQRQRQRAEALRDEAFSALEASIRRVGSSRADPRIDLSLDSLTVPALAAADQLRGNLPLRQRDVDNPAALARPALVGCLRSLIELQAYLGENFSWRVDMEEHWESAREDWRFLNNQVKPRLYEVRLGWFRPDAAARLGTILSDPTHPLIATIALRDSTLTRLVPTLTELASGDDESLRHKLDGCIAELAELVEELVTIRGQLPRIMRLRESIALIRNEPFEIGLTPGHGLEL